MTKTVYEVIKEYTRLFDTDIIGKKTVYEIVQEYNENEEDREQFRIIKDSIVSIERSKNDQCETEKSVEEVESEEEKVQNTLSDAYKILKREKSFLEHRIQELIDKFEISTKLTVNKIDLTTNPEIIDFGFADESKTIRDQYFGFADEEKPKRRFVIKIVLNSI